MSTAKRKQTQVHDDEKSDTRSQKPKTLKTKKLTELERAYGTAVFRMCWLWTHDDGSDAVDNWPPRGAFVFAPEPVWQLILQPKNDGYRSSILLKKLDKSPLTKRDVAAVGKAVDKIHSMVLDSFREVVEVTGGKWFFEMTNAAASDPLAILQIVKPLTLSDDGKYMSMTFEYLGWKDDSMQSYWFPSKLAEALDMTHEFDTFETNGNGQTSVGLRLPYGHRERADEERVVEWMSPVNLAEFCTHPIVDDAGKK